MEKKKIGIFAIILFLLIGLGSFVFANPDSEKEYQKGGEVETVEDGSSKKDSKEKETEKTDDSKKLETVQDSHDYLEVVNRYDDNYQLNITTPNNNENNQSENNGSQVKPADDSYKKALEAVKKVEQSFNENDFASAEKLVSDVKDENKKEELTNRLNDVKDAMDAEKLVAILEEKVDNAKNLTDMNRSRDYRDTSDVVNLVNNLKNSSKKEELIDRLEVLSSILDDMDKPVIEGITDGTYTNKNVKLNIKDANEVTKTVTFNGQTIPFEDEFKEEGTYVVVVTDAAYNEAKVTFTIDRTAAKVDYSTLDFSKSNAYFEEVDKKKIYYINNEKAFVFRIKFNEKLLENPILKVGKKDVELKVIESLIAKGEYVYEGVVKITAENELDDGFIELFVTNIKDLAGNVTTDEKETNHTETTNHRKVILDNTKPSITVKDNYMGTLEEKIFSKVDFKLKDQYKINKVEINGKEHKFTPNTVEDLNFDLGSHYYIEGENSVKLFDLAGNEVEYIFTLDRVIPEVVKASVRGGYLDKENNNTWYVKEDGIIYLNVYFKEELAVKPVFTINDKVNVEVSTVKYNEKDNTWNYAASYKVTANDGLEDGLIDVKVSGYEDKAGNSSSDNLKNDSIWIGGQKRVIIDKTNPERRVLGIALNGNIDSINAKNGDSIRIWVYFDEELRTLPKVKLGEKEYVMYHAPESNKYAYHLDVTLSDEMKLPQGEIDFKIYGYTDKAGNTNKELTKKDITYNPDKRNGKLVYDSIAPTFNFTNGKMYNYDFEVVVNDSMLAGMDVYNYSTGETIKLTGTSNNKWKMTGETEHNMYKITAYDWAGNTSNIWIYKDTVKPVISGTGKTADSIVDIVNNGTYKSVDLKISDKNLSKVYVNDELVQSYEWDKVGDYEHIFDKHGKYVVKAVDRGGNIETIEFNIDTEGPTVDTLRVKGLRPNKGTENFKYVKVGDTFQVILTTVEELKTLPTLYVDNQTVTNVVSKKFDNYYQYIMSYTIPQDTTLVEGEAIKFKLSGYADALNNYGKDLTNDDIKIGNGQTSVTFDKTKPKITIDRDITLKVGDKFIDDIGEHVEDNITPLDNLYIGGGWGTFKDTTQPGDYYLNYKVMDEAGNYEVATRKIHVVA